MIDFTTIDLIINNIGFMLEALVTFIIFILNQTLFLFLFIFCVGLIWASIKIFDLSKYDKMGSGRP